MKKPNLYTLNRAKRTAFGRILCRLFGEQTGAVMMEYVVLGVLLVAAVVGAVVIFGDNIAGAFKTMGITIFSPEKGEKKHDEEMKKQTKREKAVDATSQKMTDRTKKP